MAGLSENPFASTTSLDKNPFEDPEPQPAHAPYDARMQELAAREQELQRREQELNQRAEYIRTHGRNNFPPFYPLVYHSIQDEIPEASRPLITQMFRLWLLLLVTLLVNMVALIFATIVGTGDGFRDFGVSIMYIPVIGALSFLTWYRPIYNGYMKEQSLYYYVYFFFGGWHILFSLYMAIGLPSTGSAGIIQTVIMFAHGGAGIAGGVLGALASAGWVIEAFGSLWFFRLIWAHGKAAGHSFDKAKGEFATHGAKAYFSRG
ncbi:scamp-domain-containing protein [Gloeophyllum trabeum ATCC 11539]|uniref:Scamp-domain-containing protein n=1 Tax=Gloeophyllum trabeum (strain ATCC 11539 / FP-39264 / Madison 617) TaxID=670483 RepID=S7RTM5_GLOTA|nr:scamp-domain-containing protein [Gloeophyllum trabeum ATCC 11539]EPQ58025.1 scamp-domain-containing protein [Gloeophyllum trabeum ATCC 11539]